MTEQQTASTGGETSPLRGACERIGTGLATLLAALTPPDEVRMHFRAARIEILKGLRAAIDARIERAQGQPAGKSVTIE